MEFEGIVIRTHPSREADLVLRILSTQGKVSALARGVRRATKNLGVAVDIFDRGTFELRPGRGSLLMLGQFSPTRPYRTLRTSLDHLTIATLLVSCADIVTHEEADDGNAEFYNVLRIGLDGIEASTNLRELFRVLYLALGNLGVVGGFLSSEEISTPSPRELARLVERLETVTNRQLLGKQEVFELLRSPRLYADAVHSGSTDPLSTTTET